jgi:transcriptional regulator with GAF, ATPase, and Fis domain/tetratricopeptide (TPR) repeat protein
MAAAQTQLKEGLIVGFRYQIEALLGFGETGGVYACRDLGGGKSRLVIKFLSPISAFSGRTAALGRELALMQRFRHPNLVRILDLGVMEDSRELYLVEERVDGDDLYSGTADKDLDQKLHLCVEILKALQYLHVRGVVHGNLNPFNVRLLKVEGRRFAPVMLNFNLLLLSGLSSLPGGFRALSYSAPEILLGGRPEKASDIYALGIMIYQMMARKLPFEDEDKGFLIQKQLQGDVDMRPLKELEFGNHLSQLLHRMLEKDPNRRIASANEVIEFLEAEISSNAQVNRDKQGDYHFSAAPFVGREAEMQFFQDRMAGVKETGRGRTVFVAGESGSGKTRCMDELKTWALLEEWQVVEGFCSTYDECSYRPYRQILDSIAARTNEMLYPFDHSPRIAESAPYDSSSGFAAGQFQDLLTREIIRRFADRPTIIFLHDFHWADKATCAVLEFLSSDIRIYPIFICVSFRPGESTDGILDQVVGQCVCNDQGEVLLLKPLTQEDIQQLASGMTGDLYSRETFGGKIFRAIGGNPLFLEEMLKHFAEQGVLIYKSGIWGIFEKLPNFDAPPEIGTILQRRLSCLSPAARLLGNWLALFHHATSRKTLGSAMSLNSDQIDEALMELVQRQMVRVEITQTGETVDFSHDLIAEVFRCSLPRSLSQQMHSKIAETMEQEFGKEGHLFELTMHYMEGIPDARSARYALASALQYRSEYSHENAVRCFEYVFQNKSNLTIETLCAAAIAASDSMFAVGMARRATQLLDSLLSSRGSIAPELQARMHMQLALSFQYAGDFARQEIHCNKGIKILRKHNTLEPNLTQAMLWAELAFGYMIQSRPQQGLKCLAKAEKACPEQDATALQGRIQSLYASLYRVNCDLKNALEASEKAACILDDCEESYLSCSANSTLGFILMGLGRFQSALEKHQKAVVLSEKSRSVILKAQALGNLAECLCRMGRISEAFNAIEIAFRSVQESQNPTIHHGCDAILSEIQFAAADYRGARQTIESLLQNSSDLAPFTIGQAHYIAGELYFQLGNFSESIMHIEQLCSRSLPDAPFYEYELAQALRARIVIERESKNNAIDQLMDLDRAVAKKHWPYHRCIIRLHICEALIGMGKRTEAMLYAKDALRLAKAMHSTALKCHSNLLLGLIYSPVRFSDGSARTENGLRYSTETFSRADESIEALLSCCQQLDPLCPLDLQWRAHAELSFIYRLLQKYDLSFQYAQKAYDFLCKIEDHIPSDLLTSFYRVFNRGLVKLELVRLIEAGRKHSSSRSYSSSDDDNVRILLRMSASINSGAGLSPLMEHILDQLLPATAMERGFIYLRDEESGKLVFAKGRNSSQKNLLKTESVPEDILLLVFKEGLPLVSADVSKDRRIKSNQLGRIFCGALKAPDRIIGVLYADHRIPAETISPDAIDIFAASCNLAVMAIENIRARQRLSDEPQLELSAFVASQDRYPEIIGKSHQVKALKERIGLAAASPLDILITGESGTGKELVARAIGRTGRRRQGKFIAVDCGALSDSLAEAELFGYRKGAFTGAAENRPGLLEAADGGIVFLDEISNMPLRLQAKLLRVLQEREVRRIGETAPRRLDIQIIAATNKDLFVDIKNGQFRGDLYYRLKVMEIRLAPLRDRAEDIPLLIEWFLEKTAEIEGGRKKKITPDMMQILMDYGYPGNIRELRHIVASAYYSTSGLVMDRAALPPEVLRSDADDNSSDASIAAKIYHAILEGKGNFDDLIKTPFLRHQFGTPVLQEIIRKSLIDTSGVYRAALKRLGVAHKSYSIAIQFLKRHRCYLDFRPFRQKGIDSCS